ncbi:hypothetical protein Tco_0789980 [Tanacetum coccineum]
MRMVIVQKCSGGQVMALPPRDQRYQYLRYEGLEYTDTDIAYFEGRLAKIYRREGHRVQIFYFGGLPDLMAEGLSGRMLIEHMDAQGQSVFREAVLDLDMAGALQFQLGRTVGFGTYWVESARQIPDKGDLRDYWVSISSTGDVLGITPSYTSIRDMIIRMCHKLITCSIAGRSQAPKKLGGRAGLIFLDWVALGLKRQLDAAAGSPGAVEDAPVVDEGDQVVSAPVQAPQPPQPPLAATRSMPQRMGMLKEDVREIRGALTEQRERRVRRRTGEASTSAAQQDQHQPDP